MSLLRVLKKNISFGISCTFLLCVILFLYLKNSPENYTATPPRDNSFGSLGQSSTAQTGVRSDLQHSRWPIYSHSFLTSLAGFHMSGGKLSYLPNFETPCFLESKYEGVPYRDSKMITARDYVKSGLFKAGIFKQKPSYLRVPGLDAEYRLRCMPKFMLIGFPKCGTTDLSQRVQLHPLVFTGVGKELYWWNQYRPLLNSSISDYSDLLDKGVTEILKRPYKVYDSWSETHYPGVVGELTTLTIFDNSYWRLDPRNSGLKEPRFITPHDLHSVHPEVKLIVLMRNPTDRLYSHYSMFMTFRDPSPEDFHQKVVNSLQWWQDCLRILPERGCLYGSPPEMPPVETQLSSYWHTGTNYTGTFRDGLYYWFIKDWLSVFPMQNFLFLRSDDYNQNKLDVMNNQIFPFIGVDKVYGHTAETVKNMRNAYSRRYKPMLNESRELLNRFYKPYNDMLAALLNDDKWKWNS